MKKGERSASSIVGRCAGSTCEAPANSQTRKLANSQTHPSRARNRLERARRKTMTIIIYYYQ
eukprot:7959304-Pyramimonas_sp.AAC.1